MIWTEDAIAQLRALWAEGHTTSEIGLRMGCSKNAIIGKAHRLGLPGRPSPILQARVAQPRPVRAPKITLPSVAAALGAVERALPSPQPRGRVQPCCYVTSEDRPWRYCDVPSVVGSTYCAEHRKLCISRERPDLYGKPQLRLRRGFSALELRRTDIGS